MVIKQSKDWQIYFSVGFVIQTLHEKWKFHPYIDELLIAASHCSLLNQGIKARNANMDRCVWRSSGYDISFWLLYSTWCCYCPRSKWTSSQTGRGSTPRRCSEKWHTSRYPRRDIVWVLTSADGGETLGTHLDVYIFCYAIFISSDYGWRKQRRIFFVSLFSALISTHSKQDANVWENKHGLCLVLVVSTK